MWPWYAGSNYWSASNTPSKDTALKGLEDLREQKKALKPPN
jgi:hypothetical protein